MDSPETIAEQMRMFGQNMREARKRTGLAQDKLGMDKKMISYLELGERSPRLPTILHVARVLGVTPEVLFEGIGASETVLEPPQHEADARTPEARFGANLKWARTRDEYISQMTLAGEARVDRAGVGVIERGERAPMLHTILKLAWALELPPAVLLRGVQGEVQGAVQKARGAAQDNHRPGWRTRSRASA